MMQLEANRDAFIKSIIGIELNEKGVVIALKGACKAKDLRKGDLE